MNRRHDQRGSRSVKRTSGRSKTLWAGVAALLAAAVLIGYLVWQLAGTNVVAHHRAEQVLEETQQQWQMGHEGPAQAVVRIPRFGEDWEYPVIDGTDDDALARGVGWDLTSAEPGQVGNVVLAAHRITHGQPFRDFPDLRAGDRVYVETRNATYTYRLRNGGTDLEVDVSTEWPLWPVPSPTGADKTAHEAVLTLITCADLLPTTRRSVVVGDLLATQQRA